MCGDQHDLNLKKENFEFTSPMKGKCLGFDDVRPSHVKKTAVYTSQGF